MDRRILKNQYVYSSGTEASKYKNDADESNESKRYSNNKTSGKNVCTNRKVESQISSEGFKSFIDRFFADIDYKLFGLATTENKIGKTLRCKGDEKKLSKRRKLGILEKKIKYAIIFGVNSQSTQMHSDLVHINRIGKEIFNICVSNIENIANGKAFEAPSDIKSVFMKQVEINNRRRRILTTAIRSRLQNYAYFRALSILESDIETTFVSRVRNKRLKRSKDAGCHELKTLIERIQCFKDIYGDVKDYVHNLTGFDDLFDVSENVDITQFGFQNDLYFS